MIRGQNPITGMDFPDPDVIRVGNDYYMISTTMHFFPGGIILRSRDLIHWEICSYLYDCLEHTDDECMEGGKTIYGHGMWAASLRYHNGRFYAVFIAHEWPETFLFTAEKIEGPWEKKHIKGIYHDPSLLFDDDGRVYIAYGNRDIRLTELNGDMSGPKKDGFDRVIIRDAPGDFLGYEGSHIYKINGKYVLFLIHSKPWKWFRTEACFVTDNLDGVWAGGDVFESDLDGMNSGVAQGGVVDTPDGRWFSVMFQDHGAVGRIPVLVPVYWNRFGYPVFGKAEKGITTGISSEKECVQPLYGSDDFKILDGNCRDCAVYGKLKRFWQFNHEPSAGNWDAGNGSYMITSAGISRTVEFARNTLTQRTILPRCACEVTVDFSDINEGDVAGLCLLTGTYGLIGVMKDSAGHFLTMRARKTGRGEEEEYARIPISGSRVRFRAEATFGQKDEVRFFVHGNHGWEQAGPAHEVCFTLDHFCGCRFGLFMYSTLRTGGKTKFSEFTYLDDQTMKS